MQQLTCATVWTPVKSRDKALAFATSDGLRRYQEVDSKGAFTITQLRHIFGEDLSTDHIGLQGRQVHASLLWFPLDIF